jgi:hypothetical protein
MLRVCDGGFRGVFVMKCGAILYLNHAYSFAAALSEERSRRGP